MQVKTKIILLAAVLLFFLLGRAGAHNLWLNPDTHYPEVGQTVDIGIGWGHK